MGFSSLTVSTSFASTAASMVSTATGWVEAIFRKAALSGASSGGVW